MLGGSLKNSGMISNMHRTKHPLLLLLLQLIFLVATAQTINGSNATVPFHVGVLLDAGNLPSITGNESISIASEDFYSQHKDYTTRLVFHTRNTGDSTVGAASAAVDLLWNEKVKAIIGPQSSAQAAFVSELGSTTRVPIISFSATNPTLTSSNSPYFIRVASQDAIFNATSSLVKKYGWRQVVPIYDNTADGVIRHLIDALQGVDAHVPYRSELPVDATNDRILRELYKLMTMQTRVFVVHMSPPLCSRLFLEASEIGMMGKGYVWIVTDAVTNELDSLDPRTVESMQGVIGVKHHVEPSSAYEDFSIKFNKRFAVEYPDYASRSTRNVGIYGVWAYDAVWALARAVEEVKDEIGTQLIKSPSQVNIVNKLKTLPVSRVGTKLREAVLKTRLDGIAGEFHLVDNQSTLDIINIYGRGSRLIGFWSPSRGIYGDQDRHPDSAVDLDVAWPGKSTSVPKGWQTPTNGKVLRIGVPAKIGFTEFIKVEHHGTTNETKVTGFCIDVFEAALRELPYALPYELVAFTGTYDELVKEVSRQGFDGGVGDITITANRSDLVDFTLPYMESGVAMIVPTRKDPTRNIWIFWKPLRVDLWLASLGFFLYTGFVIRVIEHNNNQEFEGPWHKQLGVVFYFTFSTLVFSHNESLKSNFSRVVVIVWIFVVLALTSSYTASLTSMLTVAKLEPTVTDMGQLINNGDVIGYKNGSFLDGFLEKNFSKKMKALDSPEEYDKALKSGNVAVVFHEIPYIRFFLSQYCYGYVMNEQTHAGLGFAFPKGSPLAADISRAILNVTAGDRLMKLEKKWFACSCIDEDSTINSQSLTFLSFWVLFLITGATSVIAVSISIAIFLYKEWDQLRSISRVKRTVSRKIQGWLKHYGAFKEGKESAPPTPVIGSIVHDGPQSPKSTSDFSSATSSPISEIIVISQEHERPHSEDFSTRDDSFI